MNFPAVMKLECGSSNSFLGVRLVNDAPSAYIVYDRIQEELASERVERRVKLDSNVVIMEYMAGTEHDVDIIIYRRQLVGAFVTDIGPPRLPRFTRVSAALPSFLPPDKVAQLRCAAYQCCVDVGLRNGIYNVHMKMSPAGPKLIEINQRMGDFFIRDWTFAAWGVDLLLYLFMISCAIKPVLPTLKLRGHIVGINILPTVHRTALCDPETRNLLDLLDIQGAIRINRIEEELGLPEDDRYEDTYCNLAVMDPDPVVAQNRLIEYSTLLGLSHSDFSVPFFLRNFK
jgi:carnosine synthase